MNEDMNTLRKERACRHIQKAVQELSDTELTEVLPEIAALNGVQLSIIGFKHNGCAKALRSMANKLDPDEKTEKV